MILRKIGIAKLLVLSLILATPVQTAQSRITDPGAFKGYDGIVYPDFIFLNLSRGDLFLRSKLAINLGLIHLSAKIDLASVQPGNDKNSDGNESDTQSDNFNDDGSESDAGLFDDDDNFDALDAYRNQMAMAKEIYTNSQNRQILETEISGILNAMFRQVAGLLEYRPRGSKQVIVPFIDENFIAALLGQYVSGKAINISNMERLMVAARHSPVFLGRLEKHRQERFCSKSNMKRKKLNDTPFDISFIDTICAKNADLMKLLTDSPLNQLFRTSFIDNLAIILAPFNNAKIDLLYTRSLLALVAAKITGRQGAQNYYITLDNVLGGVLQTTVFHPTEKARAGWRQDRYTERELSSYAEAQNYKPIIKKLLAAIKEAQVKKNDKNAQIFVANLVPQILAIEVAANQNLPLIEYSSATNKDGKSFMDCDETSVRNFIMQLSHVTARTDGQSKKPRLAFNDEKESKQNENDSARGNRPGRIFSQSRLTALGANKAVMQYFDDYNSLEALATNEARNEWATILSGVSGLDYVKKKAKCELRSGALQVVNTIGHLLFSNLKQPPANWRELDTAIKNAIPEFSLIKEPVSNFGEVEFMIGQDRSFVWTFTGGHDVITEKGGGAKRKNAELKPGFINLFAELVTPDFSPILNSWHDTGADLQLAVLELSMISALKPDISDFTAMLQHTGFKQDRRFLYLADYADDRTIYKYISSALFDEFYDPEYLASLIAMLPTVSDQFTALRDIINLSTPAGALLAVLAGAHGDTIFLNNEGLRAGPVNVLLLEGVRLRQSSPLRFIIEEIDDSEADTIARLMAKIFKEQNVKNNRFGYAGGLLLGDCSQNYDVFSGFVAALPGLHRISLGDECFSLKILFHGDLNQQLETLLIQDRSFNNEQAAGLAGTLGDFPELSILYVLESPITMQGAAALAKGANSLQSSLQKKAPLTLDLTGNKNLKTKELGQISTKFGNEKVIIPTRD